MRTGAARFRRAPQRGEAGSSTGRVRRARSASGDRRKSMTPVQSSLFAAAPSRRTSIRGRRSRTTCATFAGRAGRPPYFRPPVAGRRRPRFQSRRSSTSSGRVASAPHTASTKSPTAPASSRNSRGFSSNVSRERRYRLRPIHGARDDAARGGAAGQGSHRLRHQSTQQRFSSSPGCVRPTSTRSGNACRSSIGTRTATRPRTC